MILLLENKIRGRITSLMGARYVKSMKKKEILYVNTNNLYGHSLSQSLPSDEIKFDNIFKLEDILNTPDDSNIGYFVQVDLKHPNDIKH